MADNAVAWLDVPDMVWLEVFLNLPVPEVLRNADMVCSSWHKLADSALLWERLLAGFC